MEYKGKLIQILPIATGSGANGEWKRREFVCESEGQYPRKACFQLWGERCSMIDAYQEGSFISVQFEIESREYEGRYFTSLRAWSISLAVQGQTAPVQLPDPAYTTLPKEMKTPPAESAPASTTDDDLPF